MIFLFQFWFFFYSISCQTSRSLDENLEERLSNIDAQLVDSQQGDDFKKLLKQVPREEHFVYGFRYGELVLSKSNLKNATQQIYTMHVDMQQDLFDGLAHGYDWSQGSI